MYQVKVDGMNCGHCVMKVTKSLQGLDSAATVDVDLSNQLIRVETSAQLDTVKEALSESGYPVIVVNKS